MVKIVNRILPKKTIAPMANASLTDEGIIPGAAASLTPIEEINQGKLLATHVPIPIISV